MCKSFGIPGHTIFYQSENPDKPFAGIALSRVPEATLALTAELSSLVVFRSKFF